MPKFIMPKPTLRTVITATALLAAAGMSTTASAKGCDDTCLKKFMHTYMDDLVKHDPAGLALAADVNARENAEPVQIGAGSWQSITRLPAGQIFADPTTGNVIYAGAAEKSGKVTSLMLRLKIVDGKITESEMLTSGGEPGFSRDMSGLLEPDILYEAVVPKDRRVGRQQLVSIINGYFDGISQHNGRIPAFSYRCDRYSAGFKFTNNPDNPADRGGGSCATSLNGLKGQAIVNKRFAVVDVPRGIVIAYFIIPHGERKPQGATNVGEMFKIVDGKIRSIEEFGGLGKYPPTSGYPDQD